MARGGSLILTAKHGAAHGNTTVEHKDVSVERHPRLISAPWTFTYTCLVNWSSYSQLPWCCFARCLFSLPLYEKCCSANEDRHLQTSERRKHARRKQRGRVEQNQRGHR